MAGTWTHLEKRRVQTNRGWDVSVEFVRNVTGEKRLVTFHFISESSITNSGPARVIQKKLRLELGWSDLNNFDLPGDDGLAKEVLRKLIIAVRNNPSLTKQQSITWYNNNYPDTLYNGEQLLLKMQNWLEKQLGFAPTWDQFKTYVIDHLFEGVD